MNPPTKGHEKVIEAVKSTAAEHKADARIYLSHSHDKKRNPLQYVDKIVIAESAFGSIIQRSDARTITKVLQELEIEYSNLIMIVGSDRVEDFTTLLNNYNGKDYTFDSIQVLSAGLRDPDKDDISGMSATKVRQAAIDLDIKTFEQGIPAILKSQSKEIIDKIRGKNGN